MTTYKEIVTKAIIGKGKKSFKDSYSIEVNDSPDTVLGCWVINHTFSGYKAAKHIGVRGSFDINLWYSYDNNQKTNVASKNITYDEVFNINLKEEVATDNDIIVRSLFQPSCSNVDIKDKIITFDIDKELGIEVVGDTKMKIAVEDDEEPWEVLDDIDIDAEIDDNVKEDYIS